MNFSFNFPVNEKLNKKTFEPLNIKGKEEEILVQKKKMVEKYGFQLIHSHSIISQLQGELEFKSLPSNQLGVIVQIPCSSATSSSKITSLFSPGIFEIENINKYSWRWGKIKPPAEILLNSSNYSNKILTEAIENEKKRKEENKINKEKINALLRRKNLGVRSRTSLIEQGMPPMKANSVNPDAPNLEKIVQEENDNSLDLTNPIKASPSLEIAQEHNQATCRNKNDYFGELDNIILASNHKKKKSKILKLQEEEKKFQEKEEQKLQEEKKKLPRRLILQKRLYKVRRDLQSVWSRLYQEKMKKNCVLHKWTKKSHARTSATNINEKPMEVDMPKVLIVEDNLFNILPIKTILSKKKIEFDIAKNGIMAVERYEKMMKEGKQYGVILMDLEMPLMNGYEATEEIRKIEKAKNYAHTYICGLSASTDQVVINRCLSCGMDHYNPKPINMETMLKIINEQFGCLKKDQQDLFMDFLNLKKSGISTITYYV